MAAKKPVYRVLELYVLERRDVPNGPFVPRAESSTRIKLLGQDPDERLIRCFVFERCMKETDDLDWERLACASTKEEILAAFGAEITTTEDILPGTY